MNACLDHNDGPIRVIVADDDPVVRTWLRLLIESTDCLEFDGDACDVPTAVELARLRQPHVAIVDVRMPGGGGQQGAQLIPLFSYETRLIALSNYDDPTTVLSLIEAGASGYVVKRGDPDEVVAAIRTVAAGGVHLSSGVDDTVLSELRSRLVAGGKQSLWHTRMQNLVDDVLDRRAVSVVLQPIFDLQSAARVGVEALARIDSVYRRAPNEWFDAAAQVGRLAELEELAITAALGSVEALDDSEFLAFNVTPQTATSHMLRILLADAPLHRLVVELTEHSPVSDYATLQSSLAGPRSRGLRVAIDDVGAGYSSMTHVMRLAPDIIKLDRSITVGIEADPARQAMVASMVHFAQSTHTVLLAEGIETSEELHTIRLLGVALGQGHLLGRPGKLTDLTSSLPRW